MPSMPTTLSAEQVLVVPTIGSAPDPETDARTLETLEGYFRAPVQMLSTEGRFDIPAWWPALHPDEFSGRPRKSAPSAPVIGYLGLTALDTPEPKPAPPPDDLTGAGLGKVLGIGPLPVEDSARMIDFVVAGSDAATCYAELTRLARLAAAGIVIVAHPALEPQLGEAALFVTGPDRAKLIARLTRDSSAYYRQSRQAIRIANLRFAASLRRTRLAEVTSKGKQEALQRPSQSAAKGTTHPTRVLLVSSNGVGLGHLTRLMAIARRLPDQIEPRFFTLSEGADVLDRMGFHFDYMPSYAHLGLENASWNKLLARRLTRIIRLYEPASVVFDGNWPYSGLIDVTVATPEISWFWVRRALWRRNRDVSVLDRAKHFDAVLEPSDLCANEDVGSTVMRRDEALVVPPTVLLDRNELLPRNQAREKLGVPDGALCVALQLGAGANFSFAEIRAAMVADLLSRPSVHLVELRSPITSDELRAEAIRGAVFSEYPSSRFARAFDLLICSAGYNSFHESLCFGIPTVFVPNEAPSMDDQLLRARYANSIGRALTLRAHETLDVKTVLDQALDPSFRKAMENNEFSNAESGAAEMAQFIADSSVALRVGTPLPDRINRI